MSEPLGVALVGCGTVGSGVARLLLEQPDRLAARAGRPLALRRVVVRHPDKQRPVRIPRELITTDLDAGIFDPRCPSCAEPLTPIPIDETAFEDWILAKSPGFGASLRKADDDLRDGRAISVDEFLARNPVSRTARTRKRAPRKG